ncbi:hypothetical protein ACH4M4_27975 [Streptomyces sp. NPDC017254]
MPVGDREAAFVGREGWEGWEAFERALVRHDPDLLDLGRPELSLEGPRA